MNKKIFLHEAFDNLGRSRLDQAGAAWNIVEDSYREKENANVWHLNISVEKNLTIEDRTEA